MIVYSASSSTPTRIARVKFHVLSDEQIHDMSVVGISETSVYQRGLPTPGGIQDARMGTVDRRILCATCNRDTVHCQGHSGHIDLPWPMYHSIFFETVLKTMRCLCFMCARVCLADGDAHPAPDLTGKHRFTAVYNAVRTRRRCPHCNTLRPSLVRQSMSVRVDWPSDMDWESEEERTFCMRTFTQRDALSLLQNMTDADCDLLGFDPRESHPKNMVMTSLLVPTPTMRPTIMASQGSKTRAQDDITHKLQDIFKHACDVRAALQGVPWQHATLTLELQEKIQRLQYDVFTIVNNTVRGQRPSVQRSGLPTKSYIGRIKGKDGRIRGNLMGKRVDFCARCVISPGPLLDIDQVGVPERIAMGLTVPDIVTEDNITALAERVRIGSSSVRGAETVITSDGVVIHLAQCAARQKICLVPGWTVERYLQDDDVVAFNRQPSLHRLGLMGHRVKIVTDLTMRLNLSVTAPYNADFDGDEMNLHVPQSQAARASVRMLMMVPSQIISPQANKPCMGVVQDSLVGAYRMTRARELLTQREASLLVAHLKHTRVDVLPPPCVVVQGTPRWSGKQILSLLLPPTFHMDRDAEGTDGLDPMERLVIHGGQILSGRLNKSTLGTASGGIIDVLFRDHGCQRTAEFLSDVQRLAIAYNEMRGFSVGIRDCVLDADGQRRVSERIETAMRLANDISSNLATRETTRADADEAETTIRRILSKALMQAGSIVESLLDENNAIRTMVLGGSKGSVINLSQIHACVGQQSVEGRRIGPERGTRTLSCFSSDDTSLESRGFVHNSYQRGLTPSEFFFHAMGGREGIVDTAVKTAQTGYIQRRQVKAMESHRVGYDGTVRNSADGIVQFRYSGTGFDPCRLERVRLSVILQSEVELCAAYATDDARRVLRARADVLGRIVALGTEADDRVTLPFDPARLRRRFVTRRRRGRACAAVDAFVAFAEAQPSAVVRLALHAHFPSALLRTVHPDDVDALRAHVERQVAQAAVDPGEMVGCLAAQSVGEPTTQMSLRGCEPVLVRDQFGMHVRTIGSVVDAYCDSGTQPSNLQVVGVSPTGEVRWADVKGVSRHPANGPMLRIRTASGRAVVGTASHSYLVRSCATGLIEPMRGDALRCGDLMPVASRLPTADELLRSVGQRVAGRPARSSLATIVEFTLHAWWLTSYVLECEHRAVSLLTGLLDGAVPDADDRLHFEVHDASHAPLVSSVLLYLGCACHMFDDAPCRWTVTRASVARLYEQIVWDPVQSIDALGTSDETVYDFTVEEGLQSFMLSNGLFVHNTLNTFHFAGCASKNVTLGLPRLQELLTVSRNIKTRCTTVRFHEPYASHPSFIDYFCDTLPLTTLGDIVQSVDILDDPDPRTSTVEDDRWMVHSSLALEGAPSADCARIVVRMLLNQALMRSRRIGPPQVRRILRAHLGTRAHVLTSEENDEHWVVRIRLAHLGEMVEHARMPAERQAILAQRIVRVLNKTLVLSGHGDVQSARVREETVHVLRPSTLDRGAHACPLRVSERVVDVAGGVLANLAIAPAVDWSRCYSNDIVEVQTMLGISAAAEVLYAELKAVISFDGTYVYPGHLSLIVDSMCRDGHLKPLNRFGVNREHENPLARSSYEETPDILTEAAIFAEGSRASGVSTSIILGQRARIGTGIVDARFHTSMLPKRMMKESTCSGGIVKTRVGPTNQPPPTQTIEYIVDGDDEDVRCLECDADAMQPSYAPSAASAAPVRSGDVFVSEHCQAPYRSHADEGNAPVCSDAGNVGTEDYASVPIADHAAFCLHSPACSDDEEDDGE